jgi:hypothetical protein
MLIGIGCAHAVIAENVCAHSRLSTAKIWMRGRRDAFFEKRLKIIIMSLKPPKTAEPEDSLP